MWLDLTKVSFHTYNGKAHFSPPLNCYTNELTTIDMCIIANGSLVCFSWCLYFWAHLTCSGGLQMAVVWLDKYLPSWKSPRILKWWTVQVAVPCRVGLLKENVYYRLVEKSMQYLFAFSRYSVFYISKFYFYIFINVCKLAFLKSSHIIISRHLLKSSLCWCSLSF